MAAESVKQTINEFKTTNFFCLCGLTEGGPGGIALYPKDQIRKAGAGGKYIVNMETRLVDDQENTITEPGVVGELVIKGETTMKGYYKNPEATAETIRNGWVHSGDLGVMDEEGYITLVDRKKDMIITGGENVYSKEVEDALFEHPKISMAVVIGVPHPTWGETVMAVATLAPEQQLTLGELTGFLKTRLADYKIPRLMEIVETLPVNVAGKVMKYQLRAEGRILEMLTACSGSSASFTTPTKSAPRPMLSSLLYWLDQGSSRSILLWVNGLSTFVLAPWPGRRTLSRTPEHQ